MKCHTNSAVEVILIIVKCVIQQAKQIEDIYFFSVLQVFVYVRRKEKQHCSNSIKFYSKPTAKKGSSKQLAVLMFPEVFSTYLHLLVEQLKVSKNNFPAAVSVQRLQFQQFNL